MLRIIQIVASCTDTTTCESDPDPKLDGVMNVDSAVAQPDDIELGGWIDEATEDILVDGPTYGEYHDDLAGGEDGDEDN
jgi:hypothetical protein